MPYQTKCIENLKYQLFYEDNASNMRPKSFQSDNTNDQKAQKNIAANIGLIKTYGVLNLEENYRGLQSFSKKKASPDQQHDLLTFLTLAPMNF